MDREIPEQITRRKKRLQILGWIVAVATVVVLLLGLRSLLHSRVRRDRIRTAVSEIGDIEDVLTAQGSVIPEYEQAITAPISSKILEVYVKNGERIRKGHPILALDRSDLQSRLDQQFDELELQKNRKQQLELSVQRSLIDLRAQHDIKKLRIQFLSSRLKVQQQLQEIGVGIQEELDQARLNLEIAQRELEQLAEKISNQEKSLQSDLRELELLIQIQENTIATLERQMQRAATQADRDGIVTWVNDKIGASIQPGEIVARIADLDHYRVEARISDIHAPRVVVGNPVKIHLNDQALPGRIQSIYPKIENGIVRFQIALDDKMNSSLRHNLRVEVSVITAVHENIVRLKNGPFVSGPGPQDIFVIAGNRAVRRTVVIGATNLDFVEVRDGLAAGEEIIISDMENYIHRNEIQLK